MRRRAKSEQASREAYRRATYGAPAFPRIERPDPPRAVDRTALRIAVIDEARKLVCGPEEGPSTQVEVSLVELEEAVDEIGKLLTADHADPAFGALLMRAYTRLGHRYGRLCASMADDLVSLHDAVHAYDEEMRRAHADKRCPMWATPRGTR